MRGRKIRSPELRSRFQVAARGGPLETQLRAGLRQGGAAACPIRLGRIENLPAMTGGGPVLRPSEHPFGIGRRSLPRPLPGSVPCLGDFFADVTHPGRFVALAPVRRGRQIGTVGFEHEVPQLHFARDLGQPALFKGHYAADSENEIAALLQFAIGFDSVGIGVENAPDAPGRGIRA